MTSNIRYAAITAAALALAMPAFAAQEHPADVAHRAAEKATADRPMLAKEDTDYQKALKACKKLQLSERNTCISEAGNSAKLAGEAHQQAAAPPPFKLPPSKGGSPAQQHLNIQAQQAAAAAPDTASADAAKKAVLQQR